MKTRIVIAIIAGTFGATSTAGAGDPKFEYAKKKDAKGKDAKGKDAKGKDAKGKDASKIEWAASAQAGLIVTTGNSETTTVAAGAKVSRKAGNNKLQAEANGAFAKSSIFLAVDGNGNGTIEADEISRPSTTTTEAWLVKTRYDRFLTDFNSIYVTGLVSADEPAGKDFVGGGQTGYSRRVYKNKAHEVVAEVGYDFSYEDQVTGNAVSIHSGRVFGGYTGKLSADTGLEGSVEILANGNKLSIADREIGALDDTRVNVTLALTTKVFKNVSFRFGFSGKWDNAPSARVPFGLPYADGFVPLADKLDTKTEAALIVNFL